MEKDAASIHAASSGPEPGSGSARPRFHVLGTAGHIDHGKTSLVKALTGIDTDRLKEEKERGITIELGFAHFTLPGGEVIGLIDVPGHERFIRTMVAGAVGIDAVLLVVAADESVMPQTREHLDICGLLGVTRGVVALTKIDLLTAENQELRELVVLEVRESLVGTPLEGAAIIPCSAKTGEGLPELLAELCRVVASSPGRDSRAPVRLPVDRVFTMHGFGTVATGTLWSGTLRLSDELSALPSGQYEPSARIRGLHVHGQAVKEALAGQRTAVNVALPRDALLRGDILVQPNTYTAGTLIDVELRHLKVAKTPLKRRGELLFHAATAQRLAEIALLDCKEVAPGGRAFAQLQLDEPMVLCPGDRFVLRGFAPQKNHGTTVGGGVVLRVHSARQRRGSESLLATLSAVAGALSALSTNERPRASRELVFREVERMGVAGLSAREILFRLPLAEPEVEASLVALCKDGRLVALSSEEPAYVSAAAFAQTEAEIMKALTRYHQENPGKDGVSKDAVRPLIGKSFGSRGGIGEGPPVACPQRLLVRVMASLVERGVLISDKELLRIAAHRPPPASDEDVLAGHLLQIYKKAALSPPRVEELASLWPVAAAPLPPPSKLNAAVGGLVKKGMLVRVKDLYFDRDAVFALREKLVAHLQTHGQIDTPTFKELVGQSRKYSIPLAEYFDAERLTLRVGDLRKLREITPQKRT